MLKHLSHSTPLFLIQYFTSDISTVRLGNMSFRIETDKNISIHSSSWTAGLWSGLYIWGLSCEEGLHPGKEASLSQVTIHTHTHPIYTHTRTLLYFIDYSMCICCYLINPLTHDTRKESPGQTFLLHYKQHSILYHKKSCELNVFLSFPLHILCVYIIYKFLSKKNHTVYFIMGWKERLMLCRNKVLRKGRAFISITTSC